MTSNAISLLAKAKVRALPIALAHCIAATPLSNWQRMTLLNRVYYTLSPADKLRCKAELELCRMAKRGELRAEAV